MMESPKKADETRPEVKLGNFMQDDGVAHDIVDSPIVKRTALDEQSDEEEDFDDIAQSVATISTAISQSQQVQSKGKAEPKPNQDQAVAKSQAL